MRQKKQAPEVAFFLAIAGFFKAVLAMLRGGSKVGSKTLKATVAKDLSERWASVEAFATSSVTFGSAVSEADKLLDNALKALEYPGANMGERLQASRERFSPSLYQGIWEAHKLRNRIAHEVGVVVNEMQLKDVLETYKRALRDCGVFL